MQSYKNTDFFLKEQANLIFIKFSKFSKILKFKVGMSCLPCCPAFWRGNWLRACRKKLIKAKFNWGPCKHIFQHYFNWLEFATKLKTWPWSPRSFHWSTTGTCRRSQNRASYWIGLERADKSKDLNRYKLWTLENK